MTEAACTVQERETLLVSLQGQLVEAERANATARSRIFNLEALLDESHQRTEELNTSVSKHAPQETIIAMQPTVEAATTQDNILLTACLPLCQRMMEEVNACKSLLQSEQSCLNLQAHNSVVAAQARAAEMENLQNKARYH